MSIILSGDLIRGPHWVALISAPPLPLVFPLLFGLTFRLTFGSTFAPFRLTFGYPKSHENPTPFSMDFGTHFGQFLEPEMLFSTPPAPTAD